MITRSGWIAYTDIAMKDVTRFCDQEIRELQDVHNVNTCDECDTWLDDEPMNDGTITIIEELEFWERYADF